MGLIYMATNKVNGKSYIGLTKKSLDERKREHIKDSKRRDKEFYRDLYENKDNFHWCVLEYVENNENLFKREYFYLNSFEKKDRLYNINKGSQSKYISSEELKDDTLLRGIKYLDDDLENEIVSMYKKGMYIREISRKLNLKRYVVNKVLNNKKLKRSKSGGYKYTKEDAYKVKDMILLGTMNLNNISHFLGYSKDFVNGVFNGKYYNIVNDTDRIRYYSICKVDNSEISNKKSVSLNESIEIMEYIIDNYKIVKTKYIASKFNISESLVYNIAGRYCWKNMWDYIEVKKGIKYNDWKEEVKNKR